MEDDTFELEAPTAVVPDGEFEGDEGFEDDEGVYEDGAYEESDEVSRTAAAAHRHAVESVPEPVRRFVVLFHKYLQQKNVDKITGIYHYTFSKLTDRYAPSPPQHLILHLLQKLEREFYV